MLSIYVSSKAPYSISGRGENVAISIKLMLSSGDNNFSINEVWANSMKQWESNVVNC